MVTSAQCLKKWGDPTITTNELKYMTVWDVPTHLEIGVIPKKLYCNKLMIGPLMQAFAYLIDREYVKELKTWDGCFNVRKKRGLKSMSLHSWWLGCCCYLVLVVGVFPYLDSSCFNNCINCYCRFY